jgi:ATP-binding cassette subfamily B multidrug efflux pump
MAALLAVDVLEPCYPLSLKYAIDALNGSDKSIGKVAAWALAGVAITVSMGILQYGWRMGFAGMARRVEYGMRNQLLQKLLSLPPAYYLRNRLGDLLSRAMSDLSTVREALGFGLLTFLDSPLSMAITFAFMIRMDWKITLWSLLPMVLLPPLVTTVGRKLRRMSFQAQGALDQLSQTATESFRGVKVIQAYGVSRAEAGRFLAQSKDYRDKNMAMVRLEAWYWPLISVISGCAQLTLFYLGARRMALDPKFLGSFVALKIYLDKLILPIMGLGFSTNQYVRGKVSVERLNEVYDQAPEIVDGLGAQIEPTRPLLGIRGLSFSYPQGAKAVKDCSLELGQGQWMGLAGRTGSGKSSLLKLVARLYDPSAGRVEFRGADLRRWRLAELHAQMGMVMQEPYLFSESILENIAFGAVQADLAEARKWADVADLHEFIAGLPQGYDSMLGEKGVNLSGGQKLRLALARALYAKPRLLLLDDVFSAVDTGTEERIVGRLKSSLPGTGVLLVSHRSSTLRLCATVLVMDKGTIVERGSHEELMQREGFYFDMVRREQLAKKAGLAVE